MKAGRVAVLAVIFACRHSAASAQPRAGDEDKALALKLFDEGRALLAGGHVDDACRKLDESRRLDPLPGTLLNVAVCHEAQGRAASAVAEFREARALAERDGRDDRVSFADKHLKALEGAVSSLVILVPPEADLPGLVVTRDGTPVGRAAWSTQIPVDPGEHVVEASAPGRMALHVAVSVAGRGDTQTATIALLEPAPAPSPPQAVRAAPPAPPPSPPDASPAGRLSPRRTAALVIASLGLASVGVGTYFGLLAIHEHDERDATCTLLPCTRANQLNHDAATAADVSTATIASGLAAMAVGAFLWLGDPATPRGPSGSGGRSVVVAPALTSGYAGLLVGAAF